MGGATAPVRTHPQVCAAAARSASHCSQMEKHAKVSLPVRKQASSEGSGLLNELSWFLQHVKIPPVPPQISTSVSLTTAAANTPAGTPSAASSATAEKASSCWRMSVLVKVEMALELFYWNLTVDKDFHKYTHFHRICLETFFFYLILSKEMWLVISWPGKLWPVKCIMHNWKQPKQNL